MKKIVILTIALLILPISVWTKDELPELRPVESLDVNRCTGTWFEIARLKYFFEKNVVAGTSTLLIRPNGDFRIINEGRKGSFTGKWVSAKGVAWRADKKSISRFKVRFFWPFYGQYWVIEVGKDYEYIVVGHPKRKHLWILSRTPQIDKSVYAGILERIKERGFDMSRLEEIPQLTEKGIHVSTSSLVHE